MISQRYNLDIQPSYIIYIDNYDGNKIKAKNGTTGIVDFSGTNAATVINNTLSALVPNRTWKEKIVLKGDFTITSRINMVSNCIVDLGNCKIITSGNIVAISANNVNDSMIIGGIIDGTSQTDADPTMRCVNLNTCNRVIVVYVEVKNGGYYGLNLVDSNECTIDTVYAHDNYDDGIHLGGSSAGKNYFNTVINCIANSNGEYGINDRGSNIDGETIDNRYVNNICRLNTTGGFTFGYDSTRTVTPSSNYYIVNCVAIGNETGIDLYNTKATLVNPIAIRNTHSGIRLRGCNGVSILNPNASDNGITTYDGGIKITYDIMTDSNDVIVVGGQSKNNSRNLYVTPTTSSDNITFADIDARGGVDANVKIVGTVTNLKLRNITGYVTENNVLSGTFAIDSTGVKTITITHGLAMIPSLQDCYLTVVQNTPVDDWSYNTLKIVSTDSANIVAKINITTASGTVNATAKLGLGVYILTKL